MSQAVPRKTVLALALAALSPWVQAKVAEVEPNNSCAIAQDIGAAPGTSVTGEIVTGDVDFYRVTATPGKLLQANLSANLGGGGSLLDSIIGVFDSSCQQIAMNDYAGPDMDSRVLFKVPADGVVIFAAAGFPDFFFEGSPYELGSYTLKVIKPAAPYLTGTVTEAGTGQPLPPNLGPVSLLHCDGPGYDTCRDEVVTLPVSSDGSFALSLGGMDPGYYQLRTVPNGYGSTYSAPFAYEGPETVAKIALKVKPLPVTLSSPTACKRSTQGGDCSFSVTVTNTTASAIDADVWTVVDASPSGAPYGTSNFMTGAAAYTPAHVQIAAGASAVVSQVLPIASALTGVTGQATVYVGKTGKPLATMGQTGFGFTVTARGTSSLSLTQAKLIHEGNLRREKAARQATPGARKSVAGATTVSFTGTLLNADTGTPVTQPFAPYVNLYACAQPGYALCTGYIDGAQAGLDGSFSIDTRKLAAGRYQFWATGSTGFDIGYSATFDYDGTTAPVTHFTIPPKHIVVANVKGCTNGDALPAGSKCSYSYDLSNTGTTARTLAFWTSALVQPTGSPANTTAFSVPGDGGQAQTLITLQPGETRNIAKPLPQITKLQSGAQYFPSLWLSTPDKPFEIQGFDLVPTVTVVAP